MKIVKGASGFGDAIYMRVVMEWLLKNRPDKYILLTKYHDVFADLQMETLDLFAKENVDYYCTYIHAKNTMSTQFKDLLFRGHLPEIPFTSDLKNKKPTGKTLVISPYPPMNGISSAIDMMPKEEEFNKFIQSYKNVEYIIKKYKFLELIDLFNSASLVIGQVGWVVPMAQMLDVPLITIFTKRALNSSNKFISTIQAYKIIEKPTTFIKIME